MNFLPFEQYIYETELTPKEIESRISEIIEEMEFYRFSWDDHEKDYEGKVDESGFKLHKIRTGYREISPVLVATIQPNRDKTSLKVILRYQNVQTVVGLIIPLFLLSGLSFRNVSVEQLYFYISILVIIFLSLPYSLWDFKKKSKKYRALITQLLELTEIPKERSGYKKNYRNKLNSNLATTRTNTPK